MEKPTVCVLFITYNHVDYVKQALESILLQKTSFPYKIIIADDCSTDGTREIILDYATNYPGKIILSNPEVNVGAENNFNQLLASGINTGSAYIAYLEGDDYWIDELKLQKQFDILEKKPEVGLVYGKYKILNNKNEFVQYKIPPYKTGFIFEDIILCKFLPSLHTSFFRTAVIKEIFNRKDFLGLDFYLIAAIAKNHKIEYMNEYLFVYRITEGSITKIESANVTKHFNKALELFRPEYPQLVKKGLEKGGRILLYNQVADRPDLKNLLLLFKKFEFSVLHFKQIAKWFYLRAGKLGA